MFEGDEPSVQGAHKDSFGEGIYGLRVGVDGLWKPCLLRAECFTQVADDDYELQILKQIGAMVGTWSRARYRAAAPN